MKNLIKTKQNGITLIALVITIIILIILAGVAISTLTGENGLIIRVKDAKERTIKAQLAEEMQLAIIDIQAECFQKGISLTLEKLQQELPIESSLKDNISNVEIQGNKIIGVYKGYSFEIDSQYKVVMGNKFQGILFNYKLSPEEYTNENVTLTINLEGDATIEGPEDSESITKIDDKTYVIKQNGEYEFKIKDSKGKIETRTISINRIDKNAPGKPEIEINEETLQKGVVTIKVVNEVQDNEGGSGIKEYGYFVAKKGETEYTEYKSSEKEYTVKGLENGITYTVYVVAYDKASNQSEKSNVLETTILKPEVSVLEIFDINGKKETDEGYNPNKLHIGDFVNYDAGTWTEEEIKAIKVGTIGSEVAANNSTDLPSAEFQFGGFVAGTSRNGNATPYKTSYNYVKEENGQAVTGWRVFDVAEDGSITLISAGCPEDYSYKYGVKMQYVSEYILTGNINSNAAGLNLDTTYTKRDWSKYVNKNQKATSATVLTMPKLNEWYSKYMGYANADVYTESTFKSVYNTKYESMVDNYSYYWASFDNNTDNKMYGVDPSWAIFDYFRSSKQFGVRVLVTLSSDVELSSRSVGTKTITSRNVDYTYNVWELK